MKKIMVTRSLCIGSAHLLEGSSAYVKYKKNKTVAWMYAKLLRLTDTYALFRTRELKDIFLRPEEIMIITDSYVPEHIAAEIYKTGLPVKTNPVIKTHPEGTMNQEDYRRYIQFICEKEWKKRNLSKITEQEKQDYFDEMYSLYADILGKCCSDCRYCSTKEVENVYNDEETSTIAKRYCEKHGEFVMEYDYCDNWDSV